MIPRNIKFVVIGDGAVIKQCFPIQRAIFLSSKQAVQRRTIFTTTTQLPLSWKNRSNVRCFLPTGPIHYRGIRSYASESSKIELKMPALSPTMTKGNIVSWTKKEGDSIQPGDEICVIETDKSTISFEATEEGYLAKVLFGPGSEGVSVGELIAIMVENKDDIASFKDYKPTPAEDEEKKTEESQKKVETKEEPKKEPKKEEPKEEEPKKEPKKEVEQKKEEQDKEEQKPAKDESSGERVKASPAAKAAAAEKGINLSAIRGTGPNNRIIKADVLEYSEHKQPSTEAKQEKGEITSAAGVGNYTDLPLTNIRKVIASRLSMSKQTIPHYYLTIECNVDALVKTREQLNLKAKNNEYKLSVNDFVIKAAALALRKVPAVNSSWTDKAVRNFNTVDINVAVNTEHGLFTPLISNADQKGLIAISQKVKDLSEKAKANKLSPTDSAIGTFTISNLGMFGITHFAAVINPPQAGILAVGGIQTRPVLVKDPTTLQNTISSSSFINVTLSADHRVVDGAVGAQWLQAFKFYLEDPYHLLL